MMLVPSTTKSNGGLALTVTWKSLSAGTGTGSPRKESGCQKKELMSKRSSLKDPMSLDGAPVAPSPSLAFCCIKCQRSAVAVDKLAENVEHENDKGAMGYSRKVVAPMMTIDNHMPKARNRNQPTTAFLKPAMHRKSKSKSRSNTATFGIGVMSYVNPTTTTTTTNCAGPHVDRTQLNPHSHPRSQARPGSSLKTSRLIAAEQKNTECSTRINISNKKRAHSARYKMVVPLPSLRATSFVTLLTIICIETVLLSTMSSCAKTFYMHWNTSNSIFRIDNTDHIIDVNKGNLAFEFDQVHIICPVYEPGAFENETEKYIIYNVSKVEYETCRITNADPRVIAICDKPQKLMFFTITFRPFTPQPGGLEFLPGNDYYFISTSSKDDLYRRIGGRCSTNNMKVVFKVCCAAEDKNKTTETTLLGSVPAESGNGVDNAGLNVDQNLNANANHGHGHNVVNTITTNTGFIPGGSAAGSGIGTGGGVQLKPINGMMGTSINTNIDQFNRIPIQPNVMGNNIGAAGGGASGISGTGGIMLSPGHGSINMLPPGRGGVHMTYPGHHHIQTGIRINNVPTQPNNQHPHQKGNMNVNSNDDHHNYDKHPNEVVKNEELTYNSGSGQATRSHIWIWTWLAGGAATRGLTSMHAYGINSTLLLAIIVITFQYLFWAPAAHTMRRRPEPLGINYR
ncbi:uncharacterized protein LOC115766748 [Drosophila novamexicana]|nr:uncharacterized protein LOC115766748 [Drosophila novamexicana]XP_030566586.1 uncharacterized protein LOC115766748 [Drosophila novamexicana]XP_030566587.1 uncharacterized protein LOC115766748 [Drosophila novamexicana]